MSLTPATSATSYCPAAEFLKRVDQRTIQQLCGDAGVDVPLNLLQSNANLLAALLTASGMVESAIFAGKRYQVADLQALSGTPAGVLLGSVMGGTIAAGTYGYVVTTTTAAGETLPSQEVTITTAATGSVTITWQPTVGLITGYKVYGRTPLAELFIASTTLPTYTDTGTIVPSGAPPTQNTAGVLNAGQALLCQIVSDIAYWHLSFRRPEKRWKLPETLKMSFDYLEMLSKGERIFGFAETANSGLSQHQVETAADVRSRNMITNQASRLLGTRANMYPHTR